MKISIRNTRCCFLGVFNQNHQDVGKIYSFNTTSTVQITKTFRCVHFQLVKLFLCKKIHKFRVRQSKRVIFSRSLCRFRSNLAQTRWPAACVRTSCEHARNVRKSVRTRAKLANIRANFLTENRTGLLTKPKHFIF